MKDFKGVYSFLLNSELREEDILPCYFFHGEETFLAQQFVDELREALMSPENQEFNVERFFLEDTSWMDIMDLARTLPFFLSPRRIIVVTISSAEKEDLSASQTQILNSYFSNPSPKTVLIIIFSGKVRKTKPLFKFFSSLSPDRVFLQELKPLKGARLSSWMDRRLSLLGKKITPEAKRRVVEVIGNDLRCLANELDKLVTFIGDKNVIGLDEVNQVSDWVKSFFEWELAGSLEKADFPQCLLVLSNLYEEGVRPEYIMGILANFFRDILQAQAWLKEKSKDRKSIFKKLKPHISEKFGKLYQSRFNEFFSLVEKILPSELDSIIERLKQADFKMKTSDASSQALLESFLFEYCSLQGKERFIWRR